MGSINDIIYIFEGLLKLTMVAMIGPYFIFSNTIMKSLTMLQNGADIMVEINKQILNPTFLFLFFVSGLASLYLIATGSFVIKFAGAIFFIGTTGVTAVKNVPLNNALLSATNANERHEMWHAYLTKWGFWNHVRTFSALTSGFLIVV